MTKASGTRILSWVIGGLVLLFPMVMHAATKTQTVAVSVNASVDFKVSGPATLAMTSWNDTKGNFDDATDALTSYKARSNYKVSNVLTAQIQSGGTDLEASGLALYLAVDEPSGSAGGEQQLAVASDKQMWSVANKFNVTGASKMLRYRLTPASESVIPDIITGGSVVVEFTLTGA